MGAIYQGMSTSSNPFAQFSEQSLFLVWGPPSHGPRSRVLAQKLGIRELHFVSPISQRGAWVAAIKYGAQAIETLRLLRRKRPRIIFVQSPPGIAVMVVGLYAAFSNSRFLVDAHSDALLLPYWTHPRWLYRYLARRAITTIVTNDHFRQMIVDWGGHALVIRDIPTTFTHTGFYSTSGDFVVTVVNSFAPDEPLDQVLEAADKLDGVQFYVTGKKSRGNPKLLARAQANVHFTDYLTTEDYYSLLRSSQAVLCLTTRNHTMQRGACEALSLGKPIITSDWAMLRDYFHAGTVHVDNTGQDIRRGVLEMKENYARYAAGIKELQKFQRLEWEEKVTTLVQLVRTALET
jgi:glycosyltransferase involved in cell wall biosynthesis